MGGRTFLKETGKVNRLNKAQYLQAKARLYNWVFSVRDNIDEFAFMPFGVPTEFEDKESFGDIDLIVPKNIYFNGKAYPIDWKEEVIKQFNPKYIKKAGPIVHFLLDDKWQVDVITADNFYWNNMYHFFGGMNMLFGMIARHMGISFGENGFKTRHTDIEFEEPNNNGYGSFNREWFFKFFQVSEEQYSKIKTQEDSFKFVWSSPFASKELFSRNLANSLHRKRENQSPYFKAFIDWVEQQPEKESAYIPQSEHEKWLYFSRIFGNEHVNRIREKHIYLKWKEEEQSKQKSEHFNFNIFYKFAEDNNLLQDRIAQLSQKEKGELYGKFMQSNKVFQNLKNENEELMRKFFLEEEQND